MWSFITPLASIDAYGYGDVLGMNMVPNLTVVDVNLRCKGLNELVVVIEIK